MNILDTIIAAKREEVAQRKRATPAPVLEGAPLFRKQPLSLKAGVLAAHKTGIIAEFKRKSPSKGVINDRVSVEEVTGGYACHGASGISVLTDAQFFGGAPEDLSKAVAHGVPLLRKDFTVDAYQLLEAKAWGADAVLLIAACLSPAEVKSLAAGAKSLGLEVLLELHDETELDHICSAVDLVGINNRNLKTFTVDLEQSVRLAGKIGRSFVTIAESGISNVENIRYLRQHGFQGFLIGENFMKSEDPGRAFQQFAEQLEAVRS